MIKRIDFPHSVNFVDSENRMVGFSLDKDCCESFGVFFSEDEITAFPDNDKIQELEKKDDPDLKTYVFDHTYLKEILLDKKTFDSGGFLIHRLISWKRGLKDLYLVFYNIHNGYYSHGWVSSLNPNINYI